MCDLNNMFEVMEVLVTNIHNYYLLSLLWQSTSESSGDFGSWHLTGWSWTNLMGDFIPRCLLLSGRANVLPSFAQVEQDVERKSRRHTSGIIVCRFPLYSMQKMKLSEKRKCSLRDGLLIKKIVYERTGHWERVFWFFSGGTEHWVPTESLEFLSL